MVPSGKGLLGAMDYFGLDSISALEKQELRDLAMRGGPYNQQEQSDLLAYCASDVDGLIQLLPRMWPKIDLPRALFRARYQAAVSAMERRGVPVDQELFARLAQHWTAIKYRLITACDEAAGIFVPAKQRKINPLSDYGIAILDIAREFSLNPHTLADFADNLWETRREEVKERNRVRKAARDVVGSTPGRLGVGHSFDLNEVPDSEGSADTLWEELSRPDEKPKPRHDRGLIQEAAEQVTAYGNSAPMPTEMRFSSAGMEAYVRRHGIAWPRLKSGALDLKEQTFREMKKRYASLIGPIHELRESLSSLRLNCLAIGPDGRNRTNLWAFASRTGRNQPSNSKFVFGPSTWIRGFIKPGPDRGIAYCDWSAEEPGIAAYLSGDDNMRAAYYSDDAYLWLARKVGAMPSHFTKTNYVPWSEEHFDSVREQFKVTSLGVLYGLSVFGLKSKLNITRTEARDLLTLHKEIFPRYWVWADGIENLGLLRGELRTVLGWKVHVAKDPNPRSLRNFPMQATAAGILQLACCLAVERGLELCCPVHDALLLEGPIEEIEAIVARTQALMREAAETILRGFTLRSDFKIIKYPDRFMDKRGATMWAKVMGLLDSLEQDQRSVFHQEMALV
jgi:hypothetical protein